MSDGAYQGLDAARESRAEHAFLQSLVAFLTRNQTDHEAVNASLKALESNAERVGVKNFTVFLDQLLCEDLHSWFELLERAYDSGYQELFACLKALSPVRDGMIVFATIGIGGVADSVRGEFDRIVGNAICAAVRADKRDKHMLVFPNLGMPLVVTKQRR